MLEKPLSAEIEAVLQGRQTVVNSMADGGKLVPITNDDAGAGYTAQVIAPIIADGEIIGGLILLSREAGAKMSFTDQKVAETTATIVGRQMEQ